MPLSFAIIGPQTSENTRDLRDEITHSGHACFLYNISEITLNVDDIKSHIFFTHDIYLFRGYNKSTDFARTLASILHADGKIVIDKILYSDKLSNKLQGSVLLQQHNIPQPRTFYARSLFGWKHALQKATYPLVIKAIDGQKGNDVYKAERLQEALDIIAKNDDKDFIAQDFIASDGDIRVFIVENTILGAIKRFVVPGDFRSNASLGAKTCIYSLTPKESDIALRAHRCMGYDISGVDIIFDKKNNPFILEVNHTPQWQAFKKTTTINPAQYIINFALQQYEKNRI